jgi:hypothetical protein
MPVSSIERPVSALRQRMLEDMAMRSLRSDTQHDYVRVVRSFAAFLGSGPIRQRPRISAGFSAPARERSTTAHHQLLRFGAALLLHRNA